MTTGQVITTNGRLIVMNRAFKATPDYTTVTKFKVGTGTTAPTVSDSDLQTPVNINGTPTKAFEAGYPSFDTTNMQVTIKCIVDTDEANSGSPTITEFGLVNTDGTALLFSRAVFTGIAKTSSFKIAIYEKDKISV